MAQANSPGKGGKPRFPDDEAFRCLRAGEIGSFHKAIAGRDAVDFSDADLRGADLRNADLSKVILRGAYLRDADVRGLDLRHMDMAGCSLRNAKVSGTYFPANLPPEEIRLSVEHGTRLRMTAAKNLADSAPL
ncbi:MAG TPA: pentapeptide repeat-containing protein [Sumerlaeia bacterium]|nr:pentapeptide repeat-containing protein [Sumerlaeia bacterium]